MLPDLELYFRILHYRPAALKQEFERLVAIYHDRKESSKVTYIITETRHNI